MTCSLKEGLGTMSPDFEASLASMLNDVPMSEVSVGLKKFKEG